MGEQAATNIVTPILMLEAMEILSVATRKGIKKFTLL